MTKVKERLPLIGIVVFAAVLNIWGIWREGFGNDYYAAAVRSMLQSWHNFFFVSFDPAGFVTIDKPAIGFWIQTLFANIFGYHGWALILPQALSNLVSVVLVYHLVRRRFGNIAATIAAFALASTPVLVAVGRTNDVDALLMMVSLFAVWALILASERASLPLLLVSFALVGLGFNIKMMQAYLILPALYFTYLFCARRMGVARRVLHLAAATVVLAVISLSWAFAVDSIPKDQRPYVGSSRTDSVLELALAYNGVDRLMGRGNGQNFPQTVQSPENLGNPPGFIANETAGMIGRFGQGGQSRGIFRLFVDPLASQVGWLLPLSLFGLVSLVVGFRVRRKEAFIPAAYSEPEEKPTEFDFRLATSIWGVSFLTMGVFFSVAVFFHPYYMTMMAPSIAALAGIGLVRLRSEYFEGGWKSWLLPVAIVATAVLQIAILVRYPGWTLWLSPIVMMFSLLVLTVLLLRKYRPELWRRLFLLSASLGLAALFVAPAIWSITPMLDSRTSATAGPRQSGFNSDYHLSLSAREGRERGVQNLRLNMAGFGNRGGLVGRAEKALISFLEGNQGDSRFMLATLNAMVASPLIIDSGRPVMAVGGFSGNDPILSLQDFQNIVSSGQVRYFLIFNVPANPGSNPQRINRNNQQSGFGFGNRQREISDWVRQTGVLIPPETWSANLLTGDTTNEGSIGSENADEAAIAVKLYDLRSQNSL